MTTPLGVSAFSSLGAVPVSAPLGVSAFSHLGAVPFSPPASTNTQNQSTINTVVNSPGIQGVLGAGDALRNTIASGLNLFPGVNISPAKTGSGTAYKIGNIAGNVAGFMGGGEGLDALRAASEGAPMVGNIASALGGDGISGVTRRALGTAAYGAAANNQNRAQNAKSGAEWSVGLDTIPGIAGMAVRSANYFAPQKYSNQILQELSGGQNMSDATKSVLSAVKNAYDTNVENASVLYRPVFDSIPSGSIYSTIKPNESQYLNLPADVTSNYTNAIQKLHDKFISDPTFQNAHNLQSQIGTRLREIESTPFPTPATRNEIDALDQAQNSLIDRDTNGNITGDMGNFLNQVSPDLANQYKNAADNFFENVVPYRNSKKIAPIASGRLTNVQPSSLSKIFASPDSNVEKVMSDLPVGTIDKVLYTKLGQTTPAINPITLIRQFGRLQEQGLGDYVSPKLSQQLGSLQNRINWRTRLQSAAGALAGAASGNAHGTAGAVGAGIAGASLASPLMNYLSRRLNLDDVGQSIGNVLRGTYPIGRSAVLSNYLNNSGVQNGS